MFFLAGAELRQIGFVIVFGLIFGWLLVQVSSTGSERMSTYLAGLKNPLNSSYHVRRSLEAFVNGGWFGGGSGFLAQGDVLRARYAVNLDAVDEQAGPQAGAIAQLAAPLFAAGGGMDAAAALPLYLRDKVALKTSERA